MQDRSQVLKLKAPIPDAFHCRDEARHLTRAEPMHQGTGLSIKKRALN